MSLQVIESAPHTMLTTLARVKSALGITDSSKDDDLEFIIQASSDFACRYCGRQFAQQTVKEGFPGKGVPELILSLTPIVDLYEVLRVEDEMDIDSFKIIDADAGIIQCTNGLTSSYYGVAGSIDNFPSSFAKEIYFVTYVGGYILPGWGVSQGDRTLPYDLERAILQTAVAAYKSTGTSGGLLWDGLMSQYKIGDTQVSWGNKSIATEAALDGGAALYFPPSALPVLNWYRRAY